MLLLCRLLARHLGVFAADLVGLTVKCWSFGGADGASA